MLHRRVGLKIAHTLQIGNIGVVSSFFLPIFLVFECSPRTFSSGVVFYTSIASTTESFSLAEAIQAAMATSKNVEFVAAILSTGCLGTALP